MREVPALGKKQLSTSAHRGQDEGEADTGHELVAEVLAGVEFKDGNKVVNQDDDEEVAA